MPKTRPAYPDEFRQEAVAMVRGGRSVRDVAESLGVSQQSLRKWVKQTELDREAHRLQPMPSQSGFGRKPLYKSRAQIRRSRVRNPARATAGSRSAG